MKKKNKRKKKSNPIIRSGMTTASLYKFLDKYKTKGVIENVLMEEKTQTV